MDGKEYLEKRLTILLAELQSVIQQLQALEKEDEKDSEAPKDKSEPIS